MPYLFCKNIFFNNTDMVMLIQDIDRISSMDKLAFMIVAASWKYIVYLNMQMYYIL